MNYYSILTFMGVLMLPHAPLQAQSCDRPFGLAKNSEFVYQVTDKGAPKGTLRNKVVNQDVDEDGYVITTFKSARVDGKRAQSVDEYNFRCKGDTTYFDAMLLLKEQALKSFEGKDFVYSPVPIAYPHHMKVGENLPAGRLGVQVSSSNVNLTNMNMDLLQRKVESREKITTKAGSFDCFKIVSQYKVEFDAMGLTIKDIYNVEEYYSPSHGLIKCQFVNKKGKKAKGIELISRTNP